MLYVILGILFSFIVFYYKLIKPSKYWEEKDVVHAKSWPVVGSVKDLVWKKKHLSDIISDIYNQFPDDRCVGFMMFTKPMLIVRDLDLIKKITVKDFDHFTDYLTFKSTKTDPLISKSLTGEKWRRMRATLGPVFANSNLKVMYDLMTECAENFTKHFDHKKQVAVDMSDVFSKFANDMIATIAFGTKVDSLKDPENGFFKTCSKVASIGLLKTLKLFVMLSAPKLGNLLHLQLCPDDVVLYFRSLILDNIKIRETEGILRPDLIHFLMKARKGRLRQEDEKIAALLELSKEHVDDIVVQAMVFFIAGFQTISSTCSFMAYEMALHPEIQKRLQNEIDDVIEKYEGKVPCEAVLSMQYLDQVVYETLRLWPSIYLTDRVCVKNYVIEPKNPKEKVVFVAKETPIVIPIMALHHDPKYFQNPNKFDPERFSDENKPEIIPETYAPFGIGPRHCLGSEFALLEIKILMFHLLSKFIIIPVEETEIPLKIDSRDFSFAPKNGLHLGLRPRIKR